MGTEIATEDGPKAIKYYKVLGAIELLLVDRIEGPGTYDSEINTIMTNNDLEWQKNNTMEMNIKSEQYMYSFNLPEFESAEIRTLAEEYTNLMIAYKIAVSYNSLEKIQSLTEEVKSFAYKIPEITENISTEDAKAFSEYMTVLTKDVTNDPENAN